VTEAREFDTRDNAEGKQVKKDPGGSNHNREKRGSAVENQRGMEVAQIEKRKAG